MDPGLEKGRRQKQAAQKQAVQGLATRGARGWAGGSGSYALPGPVRSSSCSEGGSRQSSGGTREPLLRAGPGQGASQGSAPAHPRGGP